MDKTIEKTQNSAIKPLVEKLTSKNGLERKSARKKLVSIGSDAIEYLKEFIEHPKHIYRWEALKTLGEIGDPISIPFYLQALEDDESDIRWIAAENLIKSGKKSIKPLLETLIDKSDSIFILSGVHHVFYDLKKADDLPTDFPVDKLLHSLKSSKLAGSIKPLAFELLNGLESQEH